ncbi:sensor histidine kinase [Tropicimonas isoalkanivorans]|uniref:histidine kinase n=1 Tax=Tropicimonas isoalkanivorans TaxID=441112 RepID=A0A1I1DI45_9RHOB|nr:HAMP domain-containing sensor histidine kinase [Tropicimonas isoalkanivorans]SFB72400.1 two-component system, NtrC family, sensor kinase [Tropicimonas isoalkanivorans]
MTSVRVRLLVLALAPLVLLMPALLLIAMTRWTADYDRLLIANVESDLRIAEQYLSRLMAGTGEDLQGIAESAQLAVVLGAEKPARAAFLDRKREVLGFDFLYFLPVTQAEPAAQRWPVIASGLAGRAETSIDLFQPEDLEAVSTELAERARIPLIDTEAAVPTTRTEEERGMVVHAAAPVRFGGQPGVLVGGILLNRNLDFIDTINALVYLNAVTGGERQGTATLFLDDVRVSTNVRLFEDVRALGTRVSAAVRGAVLDEGRTWLDRAFVVNDWYISGYLPLTDSFGERVGMLYVGFLEAPFTAAKRAALLWMMLAFAAVLVLFVPIFLRMAEGIFAPLERMTETMRRVGDGDLSARNNHAGAKDEIGQVAAHLDDLLDQVQDRDRRLRAWADELNQRVDQRTAELREANEKLEATFRQLVMSEKLASIGEITAGVAHEINNPVAVIQGNLDVIYEVLGPNTQPIDTELALIDRQVARIQAIVGKLLKFARPGDYSGSEESVELCGVVDECLVLVSHVVAQGKAVVRKAFAPVPDVRVDPGEMQQVVVNLIVNAVQAMGPGGTLDLALLPETRDGRDGACLVVADTGPGIPEDRLASVFDPFFTTKQAEGTGLGLSISQTLIQRAGGLITVRNRPEGGAEFRVWLPAAEARQDDIGA